MSKNFNINNVYNQFLQSNTLPHLSLQNSKSNSTSNPTPGNNNQPIASIKLNSEENYKTTLTTAVASIAIAGAIGGIVLAKGPSSTFFKKINSYLQKLDDKIFDYTQRYNSLGTIQKWYLKINKGLRKALESLQLCNNFTAIKDSSFKWLCNKFYLTKPMEWVTNQFKKITIMSSKKAYQNARNITDNNISSLREFIPKIKDNPSAQQALKDFLNKLEHNILYLTNATSRSQRLVKIQDATKNIGQEVGAELKEIFCHPTKKNIKKLSLYRTEVKAAPGRENLQKTLQDARRSFTFNIDDKTKIMTEAKDEIARMIDVTDKTSRQILRNITKQIKAYGKLSGTAEIQKRTLLVSELKNNILKLKTITTNYSSEDKKLLISHISEIEDILNSTDQKGIIEDILQLLKSSLKDKNTKDYIKAKSLTQEIRNSINKAFDTELKLYDKFAEYSVGSAPTDMLGLLLPVGLATYAISKGKDKDEKISATLNAGIPICGAVLTSFISTAKMMSNMQGLVMGFIAGIILNALGSKADESYKEYSKKQLFIQKALDAYKPIKSTKQVNIS